jgi:hypothetical protein
MMSAATRAPGGDNSESLMNAARIGRELEPSVGQWQEMQRQQQAELERNWKPRPLTPAEQAEADERALFARRWQSAAGYPRGKTPTGPVGLPEVDAP